MAGTAREPQSARRSLTPNNPPRSQALRDQEHPIAGRGLNASFPATVTSAAPLDAPLTPPGILHSLAPPTAAPALPHRCHWRPRPSPTVDDRTAPCSDAHSRHALRRPLHLKTSVGAAPAPARTRPASITTPPVPRPLPPHGRRRRIWMRCHHLPGISGALPPFKALPPQHSSTPAARAHAT
jgi:hypothetical protein